MNPNRNMGYRQSGCGRPVQPRQMMNGMECQEEKKMVFEFSECMPPAMSYTPFQIMSNIYQPQKGLVRGTIFPELDKPWLAGGACAR